MKSKRLALILEIIATQKIETQEGLAAALVEQGVKVTQATVSRDIKELRLTKVLDENGKYTYAAPDAQENSEDNRMARLLRDSVLSVDAAGNVVVVKTMTATAQTCGEFIDGLGWPEIIGTIAGDNTVIAIIKNIEDVDDVMARLRSIIGIKH